MTFADYAEALRLIRQHMQPGDTLGMMFMRVAKELETQKGDWSRMASCGGLPVINDQLKERCNGLEVGEVCDGCGRLLICRHCGKFRST